MTKRSAGLIIITLCLVLLLSTPAESAGRLADIPRVDVHAHVPFFDQPRFAGVQAHAHPHLDPFRPFIAGHGPLYVGYGSHGFGSLGEGGKEGVALGVDLATVPAVDDRADDLVVVGQQNAILIS